MAATVPRQRAAKQPLQLEGAFRGLRSRGPLELKEGLVALRKTRPSLRIRYSPERLKTYIG